MLSYWILTWRLPKSYAIFFVPLYRNPLFNIGCAYLLGLLSAHQSPEPPMVCTRLSTVSWSDCNKAGSVTFPSPLIFVRINGINRELPIGIFVPRADKVSDKAACALSPDDAAVINATGLSLKAVEDTVQSSAFFNAPGTPKAYSGIQKRM